MGGKNITTEEFIRRSKKVHGDKYDYRETEYTKAKNHVKIYCNKHKDFFYQRPAHHFNGRGCAYCAGSMTYTRNDFIQKLKEIHGNEYNYSKVMYKNSITKIIIVCKKHGEFKQIPSAHMVGQGCPKCGIQKNIQSRRISTEEFIEKAEKIHRNKYDYSRVDYKSAKEKIIIICKKHGEFKSSPDNHLRERICPLCADVTRRKKKRSTTEEFIKNAKKIHGSKYNYSKVLYFVNHRKVIIICKIHGEFEQSPGNHLIGAGCPHCVYKNEGKVKDLLLKYFKDWKIIPHKKIWHTYKDYHHKRYCDFWLEKDNVKVVVEYDGVQHFNPTSFGCHDKKIVKDRFKKIQLKDKLDFQFCQENNIILHRIKYNEDKERSIVKLKNSI